MFQKLLSNLAFNPSLIGQVSFYAKRLQDEAVIRRTGVLLLAFGFFIQTFAVLSPPQPTLANSNNDMISGGITSKEQAFQNCVSNTRNYKNILAHYGIQCSDLNNTTTTTLKSTDYNKQLYSMGHLRYGKTGETPVTIDGKTLWLRYLWSWDTRAYSSYKVLKGKSASGLTFFILYNCGNLTFVGIPNPAPKPAPAPTPQPAPAPQPVPKPAPAPTPVPQAPVPKPVPCEYNNAIPADDESCKPCEASQTRTDKTACLEFKKAVRNVTQNIADANGTTANANDVLNYTLIVSNNGITSIENFVVQENVSDILDYADIVDTNGGSINNEKILSWPGVTVQGKQKVEKQFTIRIKDPIPQTPVSASDPGHFDLTMTNIYGNTTTVKLPPGTIKTAEVVTQTLPNTGPGESMAVIVMATVFASYFYARARLMSKELEIVKTDFASSGGI